AAAREGDASHARYLALSQGDYVSRAQLDQARAIRDSARAARDAARAQLANVGQQAAYTSIRAPYAGIVASREVDPGESVGIGADAPGVTVFPAGDAATHAVRIRIDLPALDPVPAPGSTAKVAFPALAGAAFPRIPASAVATRGEVTAVYVLADGRLSLRQLRLGDTAAGQVEVIAGLRAGETIATDPVAARQALVAARGGERGDRAGSRAAGHLRSPRPHLPGQSADPDPGPARPA